MRQNPHVRICGGPGSATTLVYPTGVERRAPMLETVVGCAVRRRERLSAPDAPISTAFPGSRSVKTVADEVPGTDASMDRTCGIGTSAILPFGLALVDERTASLEIGHKL